MSRRGRVDNDVRAAGVSVDDAKRPDQPLRAPTSKLDWPFPFDWRNPSVPRRLTQRERLSDVEDALW